MEYGVAALIGIFFTGAVWMLLSRSLIRMLLVILVAGRLVRATPPIVPQGHLVPLPGAANPLPQALILTAIVIGFAMFSFLLVLAWRTYEALDADDTGEMRLAEPKGGPQPPLSY